MQIPARRKHVTLVPVVIALAVTGGLSQSASAQTPSADATAAASAMVAAGQSSWTYTPPPLQLRNAGRAPLPGQLPVQYRPAAESESVAADWQPVATLPSGPRSRPDQFAEAPAPVTFVPADPGPAVSMPVKALPLAEPASPPTAGPVLRLPLEHAHPPAARKTDNVLALRRQADLRSQDFRRRWLIGNFY